MEFIDFGGEPSQETFLGVDAMYLIWRRADELGAEDLGLVNEDFNETTVIFYGPVSGLEDQVLAVETFDREGTTLRARELETA